MIPVEAWETKIYPRLLTTPDGCWEFTGKIVGKGYGQIWVNGDGFRSTHRVTAAAFLGLDITDRASVVRHHCDNPPCCNPNHLAVGSARDNVMDAIAKGRRPPLPPAAGRPREHCVNGHDMSVTRIAKSRRDGDTECGLCRRIRHTEYMRRYREVRRVANAG